jgi:hypothetical protein
VAWRGTCVRRMIECTGAMYYMDGRKPHVSEDGMGADI